MIDARTPVSFAPKDAIQLVRADFGGGWSQSTTRRHDVDGTRAVDEASSVQHQFSPSRMSRMSSAAAAGRCAHDAVMPVYQLQRRRLLAAESVRRILLARNDQEFASSRDSHQQQSVDRTDGA